MPAKCRCGREWTGFAQAHCPTCHRHFSTVANFDKHRPGSGGCQDPASLTKRNGDPIFKASVNRLGTTWVGAGDAFVPEDDADPAIEAVA